MNKTNIKKQNITSIDKVRDTSICLLHAVDVHTNNQFGIIQHPFIQWAITMNKHKELIDITTESGYKQWSEMVEHNINSGDLYKIYTLITTPWKLTWLKFVKPHLSNEDFSKFLARAWTEEENPNMDANVSIEELIHWFKEADNHVLMDEGEYEYLKNLPDEVTLYRGVSRGRKRFGLSWTDDESIAKWFQGRFADESHKGQLLKVTVQKQHCLCYLNGRGEKEIVLDVNAVKKQIQQIQ